MIITPITRPARLSEDAPLMPSIAAKSRILGAMVKAAKEKTTVGTPASTSNIGFNHCACGGLAYCVRDRAHQGLSGIATAMAMIAPMKIVPQNGGTAPNASSLLQPIAAGLRRPFWCRRGTTGDHREEADRFPTTARRR